MDFHDADLVIEELLRSLGPWKDAIVIGGGYAPIIYHLYFSDKAKKCPPAVTHDIDSLIPRKVKSKAKKDICDHLKECGFIHRFKDRGHPSSESYVKDVCGTEIEVEFLTDMLSRESKKKNVAIAGIVAQPLSYLEMSMEKVCLFKTFGGMEGKVVDPGAWIFHKGLTFTKRKSRSKALKDLYGIWYVATQLGSFSTKGIVSLGELVCEHKSWHRKFNRLLNAWVEEASPRDWRDLESQDVSGILTKTAFLGMLKKIGVYLG